jgi:hypothetical protein
MLDKTTYTPAPVAPPRVTGQWLGKAQLNARVRARLAAEWYLGILEVKPTIAMATAAFRVSQPYISAALTRLKARGAAKKPAIKIINLLEKRGNGNGHLPFIPDINDVWSHMTDDERDAFVSSHLHSVWAAVEAVTA